MKFIKVPINSKKSNVHLILCSFIKRAESLFHSKSRGYSKHFCSPLFLPKRWILRLLFILVSDTQIAPTAQKMKFSNRISSINVTKSSGHCNLVTFAKEILNGKLHFLCSAHSDPGYAVKIF